MDSVWCGPRFACSVPPACISWHRALTNMIQTTCMSFCLPSFLLPCVADALVVYRPCDDLYCRRWAPWRSQMRLRRTGPSSYRPCARSPQPLQVSSTAVCGVAQKGWPGHGRLMLAFACTVKEPPSLADSRPPKLTCPHHRSGQSASASYASTSQLAHPPIQAPSRTLSLASHPPQAPSRPPASARWPKCCCWSTGWRRHSATWPQVGGLRCDATLYLVIVLHGLHCVSPTAPEHRSVLLCLTPPVPQAPARP